jgi:hypothetical protein
MNDQTRTDSKPSSRDAQRAEALRANLLRRKVQARERIENSAAEPAKSVGDA